MHTSGADTTLERPALRALCAAVLIGLGSYLAIRGGAQILKGLPDFEFFYKAGAWLHRYGSLDGGYDLLTDGRTVPRGTIEWYLPAVHRLMSLLGWMPQTAAGLLWLGLNLAGVLVILRLVGVHLAGWGPGQWLVTQTVPLVLLVVFWAWEIGLNQIDVLTLLLLVGSFAVWQAGRRGIAGFWLGLAILIKLTPAVMALWLLLKRQYRTLGVALATFLLAGPLADLLVLRPGYALEAYRSWARTALLEGSHRGLILSQREIDWRNQGLGVVLSRWLHPTNYATNFDNDPRPPKADRFVTINVVSLPRTAVAHLATAISILSLLALLGFCHRPADYLTREQLRCEFALFVLAMLWLMPVMRRYHLIWSYPAVSLLLAALWRERVRSSWSRWALLGVAGIVASQLALLADDWIGKRLFEAGGGFLGAVGLLGVALLVRLRHLARVAPGAGRASPAHSAPAPPELPHPARQPRGAPAHA